MSAPFGSAPIVCAMAETFHNLRGGVHPLFWPILWLNLVLFYARNAEASAWFIIETSGSGAVRIREVYPDPEATWQDEIWAAVDRVRPKGNGRLIMPCTDEICRFIKCDPVIDPARRTFRLSTRSAIQRFDSS